MAEGHSKNHRAEYRQSTYIAIGSLAELETQLCLTKELGFMGEQELETTSTRINRLRAMLITLGRKL